MPLSDPIPSSATDVFKRNIEDTDRLLNTSANVVNRVGTTLESFPNATGRVSDAADAAQIAIQADVDEAEAAKVAALASYAQWNSRGDWATATAYAKGDIWNDTTTSTWYLVLNDYTSGATVNDDIAGPNVTVLQGAGIQSFEGLSEAIAKITANPELFSDNSSVSISSNKTKAECVIAGVDFPDGNGGDYVITTGETLVDGRVIAAGTKQLKLITQKLNLPVENVVKLREFEPTVDGQECRLSGHTVKGIGGGDFYAILNDMGGVDNNGTKFMTAGGHSWNRKVVDTITPQDFGAACDWNETTETGTSDSLAIQRMINFVYNSHLKIDIIVSRSSMYKGLIVIPDNITIRGVGGAGWHRDRTEVVGRGIVVGTYGPALSSSPRWETKYNVNNLTVANGNLVTLTNIADAANFSVGDLVGIEGDIPIRPAPPSDTITKPNLLAEVLEINGAVIKISRNIDDDYNNGIIRRFNVGTVSYGGIGLEDVTGFPWPGLVSTNTQIIDMHFSNNPNNEWSILNLSTYKTNITNCHFDGSQPFGGNPVVETKISGGSAKYSHAAYEFAYYSHDNVIEYFDFVRKYETGVSKLAAGWDNITEGCKRTTITDSSIIDGPRTVEVEDTLRLGTDSVCLRSKISGGTKGVLGIGSKEISNCEITWTANAGSVPGLFYGIRGFNDGIISNNTIINDAATKGSGILSFDGVGTGQIHHNTLASIDGTTNERDVITIPNLGTTDYSILGNITHDTRDRFNIVGRFQQNKSETAGTAVISALSLTAGQLKFNMDFKVDVMVLLTAGQVAHVMINNTSVANYTAADTQYCRVVGVVSAHGPLNTAYSTQIDFKARNFTGDSFFETMQLFSDTLPAWPDVTNLSVEVTNVAAGTTVSYGKVNLQLADSDLFYIVNY